MPMRSRFLNGDLEGGLVSPEWMRAAAHSPAFDFLRDPEEDIYTLADGKPFHDQA